MKSLFRPSGFTLLEVIIALSIISMLVLVLYYAFSVGVRTWDSRQDAGEQAQRQEAALRLLQEDLSSIQPYSMHWEQGEIQLFAGGPRSLFYVTENGHGASSRAGSGLFFSLLYVQECEQSQGDCLYMSKLPVPSQEYVQEVDSFRGLGEMQRQRFVPGQNLTNESFLVQAGVQQATFSYSSQEFVPFGGLEEEAPEDLERSRQERLAEEHWLEEELPAQIKLTLELEGERLVIQSPVQKRQQ